MKALLFLFLAAIFFTPASYAADVNCVFAGANAVRLPDFGGTFPAYKNNGTKEEGAVVRVPGKGIYILGVSGKVLQACRTQDVEKSCLVLQHYMGTALQLQKVYAEFSRDGQNNFVSSYELLGFRGRGGTCIHGHWDRNEVAWKTGDMHWIECAPPMPDENLLMETKTKALAGHISDSLRTHSLASETFEKTKRAILGLDHSMREVCILSWGCRQGKDGKWACAEERNISWDVAALVDDLPTLSTSRNDCLILLNKNIHYYDAGSSALSAPIKAEILNKHDLALKPFTEAAAACLKPEEAKAFDAWLEQQVKPQ